VIGTIVWTRAVVCSVRLGYIRDSPRRRWDGGG
jgi:hypothetical protein